MLGRTRRKDPTHRLREALHLSRASEDLDTLPDRFASVIARYEASDLDPRFRSDVYAVLKGAVDIAEAMVDLTFPVERASEVIGEQLGVLSRVLLYLQSRPTSQGFAILLPESQQLVGQFSTREEAEQHLRSYRGLGLSANCLVVPIAITSMHAVQPRARRLPAPVRPALETQAPLSSPLPNGIRPPATDLQALEEVAEANWKKQEEEAQIARLQTAVGLDQTASPLDTPPAASEPKPQ